MNFLSDFSQPLVHLNKLLQVQSYELANIKDHIDDTVEILDAKYIEFEKVFRIIRLEVGIYKLSSADKERNKDKENKDRHNVK